MSAQAELHVTNPDGTVIGASVVGTGPPLVLVHGGTADRSRWAPLVPLLQDEFTLVMMDRRGRGSSAVESADYAIEREGEDISAVLGALPAPAMVFAHSYGATCTMSVLDRLPAAAVLLYEPPFATGGHAPIERDMLEQWGALLAEDRREAVLESFYRDILLFEEPAIEALKQLPIWQARLAAVHTLVREGYPLLAFEPPRLEPSMPVRILLGDCTAPHLDASTRAAAAAIRGSELVILPGQGHVAIDTATHEIARQVRETWSLASG